MRYNQQSEPRTVITYEPPFQKSWICPWVSTEVSCTGLIMSRANIKDRGQPVHTHCLINTIVVRCKDAYSIKLILQSDLVNVFKILLRAR